MDPIAFELMDIGLREISGKVYLDDEFLVFDLQDALVGEFDKEYRTIKIEPAALEMVYIDRGVIRDRLCIRPKTSELLEAMPGSHGAEVCLKIWRTARKKAEALVGILIQRMSPEDASS